MGSAEFRALWEEAPTAPIHPMEDSMPTRPIRALVSAAVAMTVITTLGACAGASSRAAVGGAAPVEGRSLSIRFDNGAREYVHVYLIGHQREWLLGRVEPGAVATLRLPQESAAEESGFVQLAVLTGDRISLQAARNMRARTTMLQPVSSILEQRWRFAQGELLSLRLPTSAVDVGRQ